MSVLLVTYEFPPHMNTGGIGSYMLHLAFLLNSAGHRVTVFSATNDEGPIQFETNTHYNNYIFHAKTVNDFRATVRDFFHEYIKKERVDIIESPEVGACALGIKEDYPEITLLIRLHTPGVIISKVSNTYQPFLQKLRFVAGSLLKGSLDLGYWSKIDKNRERNPEYNICMMADTLVSPSQSLSDYLRRYWHLSRDIKIIRNPFIADSDLFHFPLERREKLICFIGKLSVLKGMFTLTNAVKIILSQHPDYKFVFVGRDEYISETIPSMRVWMENELKQYIDMLEFTGALNREDVKLLLGRSQVCVVPSLWENYPTVILEAMAAGVAVAAAKSGGIPELIADGVTGSLFNPYKPNEIYKSVSMLICNDEKRIQIVNNARKYLINIQPEVEQGILGLYQSLYEV